MVKDKFDRKLPNYQRAWSQDLYDSQHSLEKACTMLGFHEIVAE